MQLGEFVSQMKAAANVWGHQIAMHLKVREGNRIFPWRTPHNGGNGINVGNVLDRGLVRYSCSVASQPELPSSRCRYVLVTDGVREELALPEGASGPYWCINGATFALLGEQTHQGIKIVRAGIWKGVDLENVVRVACEVSQLLRAAR